MSETAAKEQAFRGFLQYDDTPSDRSGCFGFMTKDKEKDNTLSEKNMFFDASEKNM